MAVEPDDVVDLLAEAAKALLEAGEGGARRVLLPIAGETIASRPRRPRQAAGVRKGPAGEVMPASKGALSVAAKAEIYYRDGFVCRYCARRTIPIYVLALVSLCCPAELPFDQHWHRERCHWVFNEVTSVVDHVIPVALGGDWTSRDNLVTTCARCNYQKGSQLLRELGWELLPLTASRWDGLAAMHRLLWEHAGRPPGAFRTWLDALQRARSGRSSA